MRQITWKESANNKGKDIIKKIKLRAVCRNLDKRSIDGRPLLYLDRELSKPLDVFILECDKNKWNVQFGYIGEEQINDVNYEFNKNYKSRNQAFKAVCKVAGFNKNTKFWILL
jgi:hypothetical protein